VSAHKSGKVLIFVGVIFHGYESCAHGFVDSIVRGYNEFYNQYKEIWEASYGEKREFFDPYAVSVMKERNSAIIMCLVWITLLL